jgi:hypothetical protein
MQHKPTNEQQVAIDAFGTGEDGVSRQLDAPDAVQVIENHLQEVYLQGVLFS